MLARKSCDRQGINGAFGNSYVKLGTNVLAVRGALHIMAANVNAAVESRHALQASCGTIETIATVNAGDEHEYGKGRSAQSTGA